MTRCGLGYSQTAPVSIEKFSFSSDETCGDISEVALDLIFDFLSSRSGNETLVGFQDSVDSFIDNLELAQLNKMTS